MHIPAIFLRTVVTMALLSALVGIGSFFMPSARADNSSPWMSGQPTLFHGNETTPQEIIEITSSRSGHNPGAICIEKKIETQILGSLLNRYRDGCWYNTSIGLLHSDGLHLLENGTSRAGKIVTNDFTPHLSHLRTTPNKDVLIEQVPKPGSTGHYLQFRSVRNGDLVMDRDTNPVWGSTKLNFRNSPSLVIRLDNGEPMTMGQTSIWWAENGNYMMIWQNSGTVILVNLNTFEVLRIPVMELVGRKMGAAKHNASVAISPSGRHLAITEQVASNPNIYTVDLESCVIDEGQYTDTAVDCDIVSYKDFLKSQIPSYFYPSLPRFYGEHTLGFYHRPNGSTGNFTQYYLQANGTSWSESKYVALGDSYSSGEGAGNYEPETDLWRTNECHTSRNSYPYLIHQRLNFESFISVACSGAKIEHVETDAQHGYPARSLGLFPGNHPQLQAVNNQQPNVVTLTMSGNDINFSWKIQYCLFIADGCYGSLEKRLGIVSEIEGQRGKLVELYKKIINDMNPMDPRLYILGYPQIANTSRDAPCASNVWLNEYQRQMANDLITYFNAVIKSAAEEAGAFYVGTEGSLGGHKLCEGPGIAVNGITVGADMLAHKASFHPNELGHKLISERLLERTNYFTEPMPGPSSDPKIPIAANYPFLDVPSNGTGFTGKVRSIYSELRIIERAKRAAIKMVTPDISLPPHATFDVFLYSTPTHLGEVATNGAGYIDTEVSIPKHVTPGIHELHIVGKDLSGEPIDMYEFVYVAVSEQDYDGDGVPNIEEPCGIFEPSGVDKDHDGIDDACDAHINNSPTTDEGFDDASPSTSQENENGTPPAANRAALNPEYNPSYTWLPGDAPAEEIVAAPTPESSPNNSAVLSAEDHSKDNKSSTSNHFIYYFAGGGITLLVILGYSVIKYGFIGKKT